MNVFFSSGADRYSRRECVQVSLQRAVEECGVKQTSLCQAMLEKILCSGTTTLCVYEAPCGVKVVVACSRRDDSLSQEEVCASRPSGSRASNLERAT